MYKLIISEELEKFIYFLFYLYVLVEDVMYDFLEWEDR